MKKTYEDSNLWGWEWIWQERLVKDDKEEERVQASMHAVNVVSSLCLRSELEGAWLAQQVEHVTLDLDGGRES